MDWENVINPAVQQDITSAAQTASPALRERTPKAVRPPPVPAAALCTPARAAILAPAVQQTERAPDLIPDPDLTQDPPPQAVRAIPAEQRQPIRQTVRKDMAGAVPVALPLLHNVKYVLKEVLWEDTATVLPEVLPTEEAAAAEAALTRIPTTARQDRRSLENAAETVRIVTATAAMVIAHNYSNCQNI